LLRSEANKSKVTCTVTDDAGCKEKLAAAHMFDQLLAHNVTRICYANRKRKWPDSWLNRDRSRVLSADTVRPRQSSPETNQLKKVGASSMHACIRYYGHPGSAGEWNIARRHDDNHCTCWGSRDAVYVFVILIEILQHWWCSFSWT